MAATETLYATDALIREFDAAVVAVDLDGRRVALDRTAFFPGGGGQPCDLGTLDGRPVTGVAREGELLWHVLDGDAALPDEGASVEGRLDWERRHSLMRTHTALHVLSAVIWRDHAAKVTGASMEPLRGRMDFELEGLSGELVREIEARVNEEVEADRPVHVAFLPREEADRRPELIRTKVSLLPDSIRVVRTVEIEGLDLQADGGTHVARTGGVGRVVVPDYKSKGRLNKRIQIALDQSA